MHRVTASVLHGRKLGKDGQLATALVWGANRHAGRTTHAVLGEAEAIMDRRNTVFGRLEFVQKTAEELFLPSLGIAPDSTFSITALSVGYIRDVSRTRWAIVGIGFQATLNAVPAALETFYGSRTPVGGMLLVRIRPLHAPHNMTTTMAPMPGMHDHNHE